MKTTASLLMVLGTLLAPPTSEAEQAPRPPERAQGVTVILAQWADDSARHFVLRGDLTAVTKHQPKGDPSGRIVERVMIADGATGLAEFLLDGSVDEQTGRAVAAMLSKLLTSSSDLPEGAAVRVLAGPWRGSDMVVPYRVSVYLPEPGLGELKHVVTVALADGGTYALGMAPPAVADLPGPEEATNPPQVGDSTYHLKVDRYRPRE